MSDSSFDRSVALLAATGVDPDEYCDLLQLRLEAEQSVHDFLGRRKAAGDTQLDAHCVVAGAFGLALASQTRHQPLPGVDVASSFAQTLALRFLSSFSSIVRWVPPPRSKTPTHEPSPTRN